MSALESHLFTNRLIHETSSYLLMHAHNPVDWYPWAEEALESARRQDKPIFLSIGYASCHWCHVMERECFEDPAIARRLNDDFVCIKVDREERPDLDAHYMEAAQMMTGSGGWPLSLFLTPDLRPFFAGTYFPPRDTPGRPGFTRVLAAVIDTFRRRRAEVNEAAGEVARILERLAQPVPASGQGEPDAAGLLKLAALDLKKRYDETWGGFGSAPKFPPAAALNLLLRYHQRSGEQRWLDMVVRTLRCMAQGGMYDQVGGGFHRYSTDARWRVPHFEKMLYDQALLVPVYLDVFRLTQDIFYADIARETLDFTIRELGSSGGGFHAGLDADTQGQEGKYYLWTPQEVRQVLGEEEGERFCRIYGITAAGEIDGGSIPYFDADQAEQARSGGPDPREFRYWLGRMREKLRQARELRTRPGVDAKLVAGWNGLMISALARAARILAEAGQDGHSSWLQEAAAIYAKSAREAAEFILGRMRSAGGELSHSFAGGRAGGPAFLDDYAFICSGLLELYQTTLEKDWIREAEGLARHMQGDFVDEERGGLYYTSNARGDVPLRRHQAHDGVIPSAESAAAEAFLRLEVLTGQKHWGDLARNILALYRAQMASLPAAFNSLLVVYSM